MVSPQLLPVCTLTELSAVRVFRTRLEIINGISKPISTGVAGLSISAGRVLDFKFLDEHSLLVLWANSRKTVVALAEAPSSHCTDSSLLLLNIPYQSLPYEDQTDEKTPIELRLEAENLSDVLCVAKIPSGAGFVPVHMEVVEASSQRGDIPPRVCLLGKDKATYKVYSLPRGWEPKMDVVLQEDVMMDE